MDLDADGHTDILTGQYNPGIITWFRGSEKGFHDGVVLKEDGDPKAQAQWFSAPSFADLDGDGDFDLVVGGGGGIRVNYNVGTKSAPKFGKRVPILDTDGKQLTVSSRRAFKTTPDVVDWDGDGILDLIVTDYYMKSSDNGATFFKGVEGGRFQKGRPLFEGKWLTGSAPLVCVTDWNEDGKLDLLVGTSIVTVDGTYSEKVNTGFEADFGMGAGPGKDSLAAHRGDFKGKKYRHSGYVYVRYGK